MRYNQTERNIEGISTYLVFDFPFKNLLIANRNYSNYAKKHKAKRQKVSQAASAAAGADSNWNLSENEREKFANLLATRIPAVPQGAFHIIRSGGS